MGLEKRVAGLTDFPCLFLWWSASEGALGLEKRVAGSIDFAFFLGGTRGRLRQDLPIRDGVKLVKNLPNGDGLGGA